jgi:hypothetical protein
MWKIDASDYSGGLTPSVRNVMPYRFALVNDAKLLTLRIQHASIAAGTANNAPQTQGWNGPDFSSCAKFWQAL